MDRMIFEKSIAEIIDSNPFQTLAKFVFADDKPNQNNQGLPFSEFERVAKSAVGMPVKMRFIGLAKSNLDGKPKGKVGNHEGSIPIGVIQSMDIVTVSEDYHQLVATAALWNDEYPDEIAWLKSAFADGKAPGISYEINYRDFEKQDNIQWIKETYTGAATFVETPAYGTRTALLALASADKSELEKGIIAIAEQLTLGTKGGNRMDEKELEALKNELSTHKAEAASKQNQIDELSTQLAESKAQAESLAAEINSLKQAALVDSRLRAYTEAGFTLEAEAEKADKKKSIFASLSDEQWTEYLGDLVAAKAAATPPPAKIETPPAGFTAMASASSRIPKMEPAADTDYTSLRQGLRSLARPHSTE